MRAAACATAATAILFAAGAVKAQDVQTIEPGMTEDEVRQAFGNPDGSSSAGQFTFYFYNNGCEPECGFPDLVFFDGGQVVDAILRAPWRAYGGESSSPKGVTPRPTPGGEQLQLPGQVERIEVRPAEKQKPPPPPAGG